ncbi:type II toxin-antitoxin system VapC family toxin [Actinopolyspora saharensis]|uniref:type II toxin-antitoxin system VapC family toxin n=1 Tax=Actinopolyspora saharensis TaxID=995062 RepID=UPI001C31BA9A|nr:type II toxin-antitoxin system VapC family toxin [Actinopolyspora saharensis]
MTLLYADTSALVSAYFADEDAHTEYRGLLLEGESPVVTSELTRIEFASAVSAAQRGDRAATITRVLDRFDRDCGNEGPIAVLRMDPGVIVPRARELVLSHPMRTLDAMHLGAALEQAAPLAAGDDLVMVTRDDRQAAAARERGLPVR